MNEFGVTTSDRVRTNVHVYPSPIEFESRMLKVTKEIVSRGFARDIVIVGIAKEGLPRRERLDSKREILRVPRKSAQGLIRKVFHFVLWKFRVLRELRDLPVDMVNCHSLTTLPLCALIASANSCRLVYEPHELETETFNSRGFRRFGAKLVEKALIQRAIRVIAVSDSIARWYQEEYGLSRVDVVLNVPPRQTVQASRGPDFRDLLGLDPGAIVFLYQGVLWEDRGVGWLLDAFKVVEPNLHIVFMGFGSAEDMVKAAAAEHSNIHYHPPVRPEEVVEYASKADVGFSLLMDDCLGHKFALPNKPFAYLQAGLPVVVSDLPELGAMVDNYGCGWKVGNSADSIAELVSTIDLVAISDRAAGVRLAANEFVWERQGESIESIYTEILSDAV